jgi:hypothetical protein
MNWKNKSEFWNTKFNLKYASRRVIFTEFFQLFFWNFAGEIRVFETQIFDFYAIWTILVLSLITAQKKTSMLEIRLINYRDGSCLTVISGS